MEKIEKKEVVKKTNDNAKQQANKISDETKVYNFAKDLKKMNNEQRNKAIIKENQPKVNPSDKIKNQQRKVANNSNKPNVNKQNNNKQSVHHQQRNVNLNNKPNNQKTVNNSNNQKTSKPQNSSSKQQINKSQNAIKQENIVKKENTINNKINEERIKEAQASAQKFMAEKKQKEEAEKQHIKEEKKEIKKKKKGLLIALLILIIVLAIVIVSTIFGLLNMNNNKIIDGVFVNNVEISNLTKEEAIQKLNDQLNNNEINVITVTYKDISKQLNIAEIEGNFNVKDAVENAYNIGRKDNIVINNYEILGSKIFKKNTQAEFSYNEELMQNVINKVSIDIPGIAIDSSYIIDNNNLIIKNSKDGLKIQKEEFTNNLISSFSGNEKQFEIPLQQCERQKIDIDKIYNEIHKEPVNAYYTTEPYQIFKEENGLDFAISLDEAKAILAEEKEEYVIPLKTLKAKITVNSLDSKAFPDMLSSFTTYYGTGDVNRNTNIAVASRSISSKVVMPGETFSFNSLIGECSTRTGYKESTIYLNGELSKGIGGGICQVSTTLYNAVLRANLEVVNRKNHSLSVTYVPMGQDAMVSIGSQDFEFKNNRDYPVRVVAYTGTGSITCQIYGLKTDTEYEVKLYSRTVSKTDSRTKVETYKILYSNGKEVSRSLISLDTYKKHN